MRNTPTTETSRNFMRTYMARLPIPASQKNKEDLNKMSILNYEEMTLESDTFQAARETFNLMLQKLFKKMEQSDMDEGSIDLKISIELNEDYRSAGRWDNGKN